MIYNKVCLICLEYDIVQHQNLFNDSSMRNRSGLFETIYVTSAFKKC